MYFEFAVFLGIYDMAVTEFTVKVSVNDAGTGSTLLSIYSLLAVSLYVLCVRVCCSMYVRPLLLRARVRAVFLCVFASVSFVSCILLSVCFVVAFDELH